MGLPRPKVPAKPLPPCAVCGKPAAHPLYDVRLCDACSGRWHVEAPPLTPLELAHGEAHPEDVEARGVRTYALEGETDLRWVLLKRGITEQVAKTAATAWLLRTKARAA